jgi:fructuronate reductase
LDLSSYIAAVLRRFRNPAIRHLLSQIAWDGSQKLPFRLLGTISDRLKEGADITRLAVPIAAWMQFIRRKSLRNERATDPLAEHLLAIGRTTTGDPDDVHAFLAIQKMFPRELVASGAFVTALQSAYRRLSSVDSPESLARALS